LTHPYLVLLRERPIRLLWIGLAVSDIGGEVFRVGVIWLAVETAGDGASLLVAAQYAAMLAMSFAAGAFVDLVPRRTLLIGAELTAAAISLGAVIYAYIFGLSLPLLVVLTVVLSAIGVTVQPVLIGCRPVLAPAPGTLRAANGLFDATVRMAQATGPFLAAGLVAIAPAVHVITVNGLSFLAAALAIAAVGARLDRVQQAAGDARSPIFARLLRGAHAANRCAGAWLILGSTGVRGAAYTLGFVVGVPLLISQTPEGPGLAGLAVVFGLGAASEIACNLLFALLKPKRPWKLLFSGYIVISLGVAAVGGAYLLAPGPLKIPAMALAAAAIGAGSAAAGMQMLTFFGSRLEPDDFAAVLRLRLALVLLGSIAAGAAGPALFQTLGVAPTIVAAGLIAAAPAVFGFLSPVGREADRAATAHG
jgi:MFS transporter, DHA3 family, macrolide efflux protein